MLDFGGSLGSSYFQNKKFLEELSGLKWSIIEQPHIVDTGQKYIQNQHLKFYKSIDECAKIEDPNVALLSSVLQYVEKPFEIFSNIMNLNIDMIILDRTPFIKNSDHDLIKIQKTPSSIYSAVYPIHFFNKDNFYNFISSHHYEIEIEFKSLDRLDPLATWEGMIIKRMKSK